MRGQPPGLYLEALRQAAEARNDIVTTYLNPPPRPQISSELVLTSLAWTLYYIDTIAWDKASVLGSRGWVLESHWNDPFPVFPWHNVEGDAPMLAEIGDAARVNLGNNVYEFPPELSQIRNTIGPWIRQVRKVIQAKTRVTSGDPDYSLTDFSGMLAPLA